MGKIICALENLGGVIMNVLVTGNLGYIGPVLGKFLKDCYSNLNLTGFDTGYFSSCLTSYIFNPDTIYDFQIYGDIRTSNFDFLDGIDIVVHLAGISNDPMGNNFEKVTSQINSDSSYKFAKIAKEKGVSKFIFASSCSMYGSANSDPKKEADSLNPLTAYARSKLFMEEKLKLLSDNSFESTCLRYSTACGMSSRLRLDLVLNDFVASSISNKSIEILSDGSPWRPLIDVQDMSRSIAWAISRNSGENFLAINVGKNEWNYQVKEIANTVADVLGGVKVKINSDASPDKRSYKVDFSLYESIAKDFLPSVSIEQSAIEIYDGLKKINFSDKDFRNSSLIRLKTLNMLKESSFLTEDLYWNFP